MATPLKKPVEQYDESHYHRIRITLTSRNVKNLEKGTFHPFNFDPFLPSL
jgi:hypothetical protein